MSLLLLAALAQLPAPRPAPRPAAPAPPPAPPPAYPRPGDRVLAALLLDTPPGVPEPLPSGARWPAVRDALHAVAVAREVLDPREARYVLTDRDTFSADLNMLRRRSRELADAPPLADRHRFPDRETANELVRFNRRYRTGLADRLEVELDRAPLLRTIVWEADQLYQVWDAVRDAQCEFYHVSVRRHALRKLRDLVGAEAYAAGDLPPGVPVWRFNVLR